MVYNGFSSNSLLWTCLAFGLFYYYFNKFLKILLRSYKVKSYKCSTTIQLTWNICFYSASLMFLWLYYKYFVVSRVNRWFPKYRNVLFMPTANCSLFNSISLILTSFYTVSMLLTLNEKEFSTAATKFLYIFVLITLNVYGYENYSIFLNIIMGLLNLFTDCLLTAALHTREDNLILFRSYLTLRLLSWSYIYLNLLPFQYLIPTLYAKNFKFWLNVFLWSWYGASVWNSPILQYFYHQIYHMNSYEMCIGNESISRCLLLKDTPDIHHFNCLRKAFYELKLSYCKKDLSSVTNESSTAATTYQTIKCMMTLKRKLRRIRENKDPNSENQANVPMTDR